MHTGFETGGTEGTDGKQPWEPRRVLTRDLTSAGFEGRITQKPSSPKDDVLAYLASELCSWKPQLRYNLLATCTHSKCVGQNDVRFSATCLYPITTADCAAVWFIPPFLYIAAAAVASYPLRLTSPTFTAASPDAAVQPVFFAMFKAIGSYWLATQTDGRCLASLATQGPSIASLPK
jgi:hypothetical protein